MKYEVAHALRLKLCKNISAGDKAWKIICKQQWVMHSTSNVLCLKLPQVINPFPLRINNILKRKHYIYLILDHVTS